MRQASDGLVRMCEGRERYQTMTLDTHEFIRRFLLRVLPKGFQTTRVSPSRM